MRPRATASCRESSSSSLSGSVRSTCVTRQRNALVIYPEGPLLLDDVAQGRREVEVEIGVLGAFYQLKAGGFVVGGSGRGASLRGAASIRVLSRERYRLAEVELQAGHRRPVEREVARREIGRLDRQLRVGPESFGGGGAFEGFGSGRR
jgi:hypothetical protein